ASGTPSPTYQWRRAGVPLSDGGEVSGATTSTLTISPVGAGDIGSYDVVVTNACGSATSTAASLTSDGAPAISTPPAPQPGTAPARAMFRVVAGGTGPFTYQWRRNEINLADGGHVSGSQTATLTISPTSLVDGATYDVVVGNACSSTTSDG